jgi:hypothetical protein
MTVAADTAITAFVAARIAEPPGEGLDWADSRRHAAEMALLGRIMAAATGIPDASMLGWLTAGEWRRLCAARWDDHPDYDQGWAFGPAVTGPEAVR